MPGIIDPSDAAFIGGFLASIVAIIRGFKAGDQDKKADPILPEKVNTFADLELLAQSISLNTATTAKLTVVLEEAVLLLKSEAQRHTIEDAAEQRAMLKLIADQLKGQGLPLTEPPRRR